MQATQPLVTQPVSAPLKRTPLVAFAAGSLILPFADLETAFEAQNPDVDVLSEYHGSIQVMRHVTDIHELIDVVVTADNSLIPMLMYATRTPLRASPTPPGTSASRPTGWRWLIPREQVRRSNQ